MTSKEIEQKALFRYFCQRNLRVILLSLFCRIQLIFSTRFQFAKQHNSVPICFLSQGMKKHLAVNLPFIFRTIQQYSTNAGTQQKPLQICPLFFFSQLGCPYDMEQNVAMYFPVIFQRDFSFQAMVDGTSDTPELCIHIFSLVTVSLIFFLSYSVPNVSPEHYYAAYLPINLFVRRLTLYYLPYARKFSENRTKSPKRGWSHFKWS